MPKLLQYTYFNAMVLLLFNYASVIDLFIMKLYEIFTKLRVVHSVYRKGKMLGYHGNHMSVFFFFFKIIWWYYLHAHAKVYIV